MSWADWLINKR